MLRKLIPLSILVLLAISYFGCGGDDNGTKPPPVPPVRLVAEAHEDPTIENALTSEVWDLIEAISIPVGLFIDDYLNPVYNQGCYF